MADENSQPAVKEGSGETATSESQETGGKAPVSEITSPPKVPEKSVPYNRFQQVIAQKNDITVRFADLENRLKTQEAFSRQSVTVGQDNKHLKKLVDAGMEEGLAKTFMESMEGTAKEYLEERVAPLEQYRVQAEVNEWSERFSRSHSDYAELEPVMYEVFQKLPETTRNIIASDPKGLELLYSHAKMLKLEAGQEGKVQEGIESAYANKSLKQAIAGTTGTAVPPNSGDVSRKSINDMSLEEYTKNREDIIASMRSGKVA